MRLTVGVLILTLAATTSSADPDQPVDWAAQVKAVTWSLDHNASVLDSVRAVTGYNVVLVHDGATGSFGDLVLRIENKGKKIYSWDGHSETPLVVDGDTLYYSEHSPISSGATIVKVNLKTGKVIWRASLQGIGPVSHSKYRNRVKLAVAPDVITVQGEESSGSYVELVDPKTGKTLANERRSSDAGALDAR